MKGQYDEKYLRKCHKRLRELGAPLENWSCIEVEDGETADFICELCGCDRVRFIHVMAHAEYDGVLQVGCICAGGKRVNRWAARLNFPDPGRSCPALWGLSLKRLTRPAESQPTGAACSPCLAR